MPPRKWRALLLSTGHDKSAMRLELANRFIEIGFSPLGYDVPGYPADTDCHSHEACLRAVSACDFAVAFLDEEPGGALAVGELTESARDQLFLTPALDIASPSFRPTILQAEILVSRLLERPTLVLSPRRFESRVSEAISTVLAGDARMIPRSALSSQAPPIAEFVSRRDWWGLHRCYEVDVPGSTFGQVAFLEFVRRNRPNWLHFYRESEAVDLPGTALLLAADLQRYFGRPDHWLPRRMSRSRNPLDDYSVGDLEASGGLVAPAIEVQPGGPELSVEAITAGLAAGRSLILLGGPGAGKSTVALAVSQGLARNVPARLDRRELILVDMRSAPVTRVAEELVRNAVGVLNDRAPWPVTPSALAAGVVILDGLDEWSGAASDLGALVTDLSTTWTVLATTRGEFSDRRFLFLRELFDSVATLGAWDIDRIRSYAEWLRERGSPEAADWIAEAAADADRSFLGIPLWLSMCAFLLRASAGEVPQREWTDERLISECAHRIRDDQGVRHGVEESVWELLEAEWRRLAWELHSARQQREPLPQRASIADERIVEAVGSLLEGDAEIIGFFHEVFLEYWLAEHYASVLKQAAMRRDRVLHVLELQRSPLTNRLIRHLIGAQGIGSQVSGFLRTIFAAGPHPEFVDNQLVYFIARFDGSPANLDFLREVFRDESLSIYVRLSAAFGALHNLDEVVRDELLVRLKSDRDWAATNGGYHLYYYGDVAPSGSTLIPPDDGSSDANATCLRLVKRIRRQTPRARLLRPVEILTLSQLVSRRPDRVSRSTLEMAEEVIDRGSGGD